MMSEAVDVEFGSVSRCGAALRAEMRTDGGELSFAQLFSRASTDDRERLLAALHNAVHAGSFEELVEIDGRQYRVTGDAPADRPGLVEGRCREVIG